MTAPLPENALTSLAQARSALDEAAMASESTRRYAAAHVAALRATAALLAVRTGPTAPAPGRGGPRNAWALLAQVAPEWAGWATYFSAGAGKRAAAEAGLSRLVTVRHADVLVRDVEHYLLLVQQSLGVSPQQVLPTWAAGVGPADVA